MSSGQMWAPLEAGSSQVLEAEVGGGKMRGDGIPSLPRPLANIPMGGTAPSPQLSCGSPGTVPGVLVAHGPRCPLLAQRRLVHGGPRIILPLDKSGQSLLEDGGRLVMARTRSPPSERARAAPGPGLLPCRPGLRLISQTPTPTDTPKTQLSPLWGWGGWRPPCAELRAGVCDTREGRGRTEAT